jgi:hypothetical protein
VSCKIISSDELDNTTPVIPPNVNKNTNPIHHINGALILK